VKHVEVVGFQFNNLPGHVTLTGRGEGSTLRIAVMRRVADMLHSDRIKHKRVGSFKMTVAVTENGK
jgi:hypothetical protein